MDLYQNFNKIRQKQDVLSITEFLGLFSRNVNFVAIVTWLQTNLSPNFNKVFIKGLFTSRNKYVTV
jgi:hypothetical protein